MPESFSGSTNDTLLKELFEYTVARAKKGLHTTNDVGYDVKNDVLVGANPIKLGNSNPTVVSTKYGTEDITVMGPYKVEQVMFYGGMKSITAKAGTVNIAAEDIWVKVKKTDADKIGIHGSNVPNEPDYEYWQASTFAEYFVAYFSNSEFSIMIKNKSYDLSNIKINVNWIYPYAEGGVYMTSNSKTYQNLIAIKKTFKDDFSLELTGTVNKTNVMKIAKVEKGNITTPVPGTILEIKSDLFTGIPLKYETRTITTTSEAYSIDMSKLRPTQIGDSYAIFIDEIKPADGYKKLERPNGQLHDITIWVNVDAKGDITFLPNASSYPYGVRTEKPNPNINTLSIIIPNEPNYGELSITKLEEDGVTRLPGAQFNVTATEVSVPNTGTALIKGSSSLSGNSGKITLNVTNNKVYNVTITETVVPNGYKQMSPITFQLLIDNMGVIHVAGNANVTVSNNLIRVTAVNEKISTPIGPEGKGGHISGYVWVENSKDGIIGNYVRDNGDTSLAGVKVYLCDTSGNALSGYSPTTTNAQGFYSFDIPSNSSSKLEDHSQYTVKFEYDGEKYQAIPRVSPDNAEPKDLTSDNSQYKNEKGEKYNIPKDYNIKQDYPAGQIKTGYSKSVEDSSKRTEINNRLATISGAVSGGNNTITALSYAYYAGRVEHPHYVQQACNVANYPSHWERKLDCKIISHVHTNWRGGCYELICDIAHTHKAACAVFACDIEPHVHSDESGPCYAWFRKASCNASANPPLIGGSHYEHPNNLGLPLSIHEVHAYSVNLGLMLRPKADLGIKKDIVDATIEINGKKTVVTYREKQRPDGTNADFEIEIKASDYYNVNLPILASDVAYKAGRADVNGVTPHSNNILNELRITIKYKISLRNKGAVDGTVDEVVDYYDKNALEYNERCKAAYDKDMTKTIANVTKGADNGAYGSLRIPISYEANGSDIMKIATTKQIYVTFEVKKDPVTRQIITGNKFNHAEIAKFTTYVPDSYYKMPAGNVDINEWTGTWSGANKKYSKTVFGKTDVNSTPGNYNPNTEQVMEDDNDKAPGLNVTIITDPNKARKLNGNVWDDLNKNGLLDDSKNINGIKVELIETIFTGGEYIWGETYTKNNGFYEFKDFIPGNYKVRFTYGDYAYVLNPDGSINSSKVKDIITTGTEYTADGERIIKMYSGQDYESTIYDASGNKYGRPANYPNGLKNPPDEIVWKFNGTNITFNGQAVQYTPDGTKKDSDAIDLGWRREEVNNWSETVANKNGEVLYLNGYIDSNGNVSEANKGKLKEFMDNTAMYADTHETIIVEWETETVNDIDLGLRERPKAGFELRKQISGLRLTTSDGQVKELSNLDGTGIFAKLKNMSGDIKARNNGDLYLIQINENLMQGATIEIEYTITVKNVGEIAGTIDKIIDYVDYDNNSIIYRADAEFIGGSGKNQDTWEVKTRDQLDGIISQDVKNNLGAKSGVERQYLTTKTGKEIALNPNQQASLKVVVSRTITETNGADELSYENDAEIIQYNTKGNPPDKRGRRDYLTVPGNFDPTVETKKFERDSDKAAKVTIIPPLGDTSPVVYFVITFAALAVLGTSIVIIKKKVL